MWFGPVLGHIYGSSVGCLNTQECQCNLFTYIGRNQNSINNIAWGKVGPWPLSLTIITIFFLSPKFVNSRNIRWYERWQKVHFWTTYLPRLVNVVCECPLILLPSGWFLKCQDQNCNTNVLQFLSCQSSGILKVSSLAGTAESQIFGGAGSNVVGKICHPPPPS